MVLPVLAPLHLLYRRVDNEERGRHLVATCALERGRLVLAERPLLAMPSLDNQRYHATCHNCLAFVGGPHTTLQRRRMSNHMKTPPSLFLSSLSLEKDDNDYTILPCRNGCGHVYCSDECERDAWSAHHFCLCTGKCESDDDAIVRFKRFCVETNEILLLVAEWWVAQHTTMSTIILDDPIRQSCYTDFQMNPWWEILTDESKKQSGDCVGEDDSHHNIQVVLETMCQEAANLLNLVFAESSVPIPAITPLDVSQRIGACEQNAMGIRQRSPLCRDVFDILLPDDNDKDDCTTRRDRSWECQALVQCMVEAGFIIGSRDDEDDEDDENDNDHDDVSHDDAPMHEGLRMEQNRNSIEPSNYVSALDTCSDGENKLMEEEMTLYGTPEEIANFISKLRIDEDGSVRDLAVPTSGSDEFGIGDDLDLLFPPLDGTAMYSITCKMNHSCDPNIMVVYRRLPGWGRHFPLTAFCVAIRNIEANEELTISYIDANESLDERTKSLSSYGFTCQCHRCVKERENKNGKDSCGVNETDIVTTDLNDEIFGSESDDDDGDVGPDDTKDDLSRKDGFSHLQRILSRLDTTANHSRFGTIPQKALGSLSAFVLKTAKEIARDDNVFNTVDGDKRCGLLDQCVSALQQRDYCLAKIVGSDLESLVASSMAVHGGFANLSERALYWCAALTTAVGLAYDYNFLEAQLLCDKAFTFGLCSTTDAYVYFFQYVEQFSTQMSRGPYCSVSIGWNGTNVNEEVVVKTVVLLSPISENSLRDMSCSEFEMILDRAEPVVFRKMASHWQAIHKWKNLRYLCDLGGHRLVPIELGSMLLGGGGGGHAMKETFLPFRQFIEEYMVKSNQHGSWSLDDGSQKAIAKVAYLAQHPLMQQITTLRNDVTWFDFFRTEPKETMMWVGTGGTRTPLHFDSYDNLFCQVVGWKYIRLYAPDQTPKLYVSSSSSSFGNHVDDSSLSSFVAKQGNMSALDCEQEDFTKHPWAADAVFTDVLLAPGDCLFIPAQTWHYVRSLTTSISVNHWL